MITKYDINISNLSYCSKDFYQIYPEIVDLVKNLTEGAYDPENTNESDPGIVLLKVAAFLADKINYNIDKNILEVFITSATQEDSFRKICEMLGYNIKYYNSAETTVSVMWTGEDLPEEGELTENTPRYIVLPPFKTVLTNEAKDVSYVLTGNGITLTHRYEAVEAPVMQGELVDLEINTDNIVLANNIDDNNRLYLPEQMIAENGIWITNASDKKEWKRVDNLNTQLKGNPVWKFGYDSSRQTPYIEFPSDYPSLMQEGLQIKYIRTSGASGNIKAGILTKLMNNSVETNIVNENNETPELDIESNLVIKNLYATTNGTNIETLTEAYNGFKRTIGTFDTLTTCRDYSNAIYAMVVDEKTDNTPLVSNCQVSDIRDELNYAKTVASYSSLGTTYLNVSDQDYVKGKITTSRDVAPQDGFYLADKITDFDLFLYPLNPIKNKYSDATFKQSFQPLSTTTNLNYTSILANLEDYKTISHKINLVEDPNDLYLIKNYYDLKGKIITRNKVNKFEEAQIKANIYDALYRNFNARQLEYGEEIPYESLVSVIENSDERIRTVLLDEPDLSTVYMTANGKEKALKYMTSDEDSTSNYYKYVAKNVLAGKVPLFNYNTAIQSTFYECNGEDDNIYGGENNYYQSDEVTKDNSITYISTNYRINPLDISTSKPLKLEENEGIQLICSKLVAEVTYPMYTNYNLILADSNSITVNTPYQLQNGDNLYINYTDSDKVEYWIRYYKDGNDFKKETWKGNVGVATTETFSGIIQANIELPPTSGSFSKTSGWPSSWPITGLYSLKTSQEISVMKRNSASIKQTALVYWLGNNNNTLSFTNVKDEIYECILNDGEYFFYTNKAKTDLLTLGPGTKLTYHASINEKVGSEWPDTIIWALNEAESITKEDVAENGIGAFAQNDWIQKNWNDNNYLETEQMEIINLGKSVEITELTVKDGSSLSSEAWSKLNKIQYIQNNQPNTIESVEAVKEWSIRSVLDLNMGPSRNQTLKENQSITLYTSWYTQKGESQSSILTDEAVKNLLKQNPASLVEHIKSKSNELDSYIHKFEPIQGKTITLKSNFYIQKSGGSFISAHTIGLNGSTKDNLLIYSVKEALPVDGENKVLNLKSSISIQTLKDLGEGKNYIELPVYIPENNFILVSVYYNAQEGQTLNVALTYKGSPSTLPVLKEWKTDAAVTEIDAGLHILKIFNPAQETKLKISTKENSSGSLLILSAKLVDCANELKEFTDSSKTTADCYGLNYKLLGIPASASKEFLEASKIKTSSANTNVYNFYATLDIDNSMLLDVTDLSDPRSFFNYNNAVNKFVLSELNTDTFKDIEIASSSKL